MSRKIAVIVAIVAALFLVSPASAAKPYAVEAVSAAPGQVVATAIYPDDSRNYWLALTSDTYDVYRVVQEFGGWDAPQPITFSDGVTPLAPGDYTLALRERYACGHDICWRTRDSLKLTVAG